MSYDETFETQSKAAVFVYGEYKKYITNQLHPTIIKLGSIDIPTYLSANMYASKY